MPSAPHGSPTFQGQAPVVSSHFGALDELEALVDDEHFFTWIVKSFGDAIGSRTLEVGAGLGTVSRTIRRLHPTVSVTALEPAGNVYPRLVEQAGTDRSLVVRQATSHDVLAEGDEAGFDTLVYVNVLEHIEDDRGELGVAHRLLSPGGHLCVFVPAMPRLYSAIDFKSGHYRRYTKPALRSLVEQAGFEVVELDYFDVASVVPYWIVYKLLRVETLGKGSNSLFDKVLVPVSKALQAILRHPPFGKNLILVARRPS
jgi:SAM-dependent methyltransferase